MLKKRFFITWPFFLGFISMIWIAGVTFTLMPLVHENQSPLTEIAFVLSGVTLAMTAMLVGLRERMRREPGTKATRASDATN